MYKFLACEGTLIYLTKKRGLKAEDLVLEVRKNYSQIRKK